MWTRARQEGYKKDIFIGGTMGNLGYSIFGVFEPKSRICWLLLYRL